MNNLMNNLSALRGKYKELLRRLQGDPFKNARKLFVFRPKDRLLGEIDELKDLRSA